MQVSLFDFHLPKEKIALRPFEPRHEAKMLHVDKDGVTHDKKVKDLLDFLKKGDCLVLNNTKVIKAFLDGRIISNGRNAALQVNLLKMAQGDVLTWSCFVKGFGKLRVGEEIDFGSGVLKAICESKNQDTMEVILKFACREQDFFDILDRIGQMPVPPYIAKNRKRDENDEEDYQTLFALHEGSVAAPTASLHLNRFMLDKIAEKGVETVFVTLHVGAGTFLPVKVDNTQDHLMHAEYAELSVEYADRLNAIKAKGGRIIAVGSTALRVLETAATDQGRVEAYSGETDIFITPGYEFKMIDVMMTNFHLPKSTLFMLVCAVSGFDVMHAAYKHAIENDYRFYSYGDACLLEKRD